jgi:hypothetical protein
LPWSHAAYRRLEQPRCKYHLGPAADVCGLDIPVASPRARECRQR